MRFVYNIKDIARIGIAGVVREAGDRERDSVGVPRQIV